jgi:hypothetical protein
MAKQRKQRTVRGAYSADFKESKVTGLDGDSYYPSRKPNVYVNRSVPIYLGTDKEGVNGGFSGPVSRNR